MQKITFYPLDNADCCRIDTQDGHKILVDYADNRPDYDLPAKLREDLKSAKRNHFDVVAFTHMDTDHIKGFSEFFYLEHAKKYQGGNRVKITTLWVPASVLLESNISDEQQILRAEARHRLKQGHSIRVFSNPDKLTDWLKENDINPKDVEHLITHAGQLAPEYSLNKDGIEFFIHSPFSASISGKKIDRNNTALVFQTVFKYGGKNTRLLMGADIDSAVWSDIVDVTKYFDNDVRLEWDIVKVSHHCSYKALNLGDKCTNKTKPVPNVEWLFAQGGKRGKLISSSKPIPTNDDDIQPPHRQAANYYRSVAGRIDGEFKVTMEHPKKPAPAPLAILIDNFGATIEKKSVGVSSIISSKPAPRAG